MSLGTTLGSILAAVRRRAADRRRALPLASIRERAVADRTRRRRFLDALAGPGLSIIAEFKRRSPSGGEIDESADAAARAATYRRGGAAAVSVLTESDHFGGGLDDLKAVQGILPTLRKDFILDEGMVLESAIWGADAVLLIAACLSDGELDFLRGTAATLGLAVLIEARDEDELRRAALFNPDAVGVNARDLDSMRVDRVRALRLLAHAPPGPLRVSESGHSSRGDFARSRAAGADAVLVGEALMRARDPAVMLRRWSRIE